jgi:succinate-semialdehyde dehydrogenase
MINNSIDYINEYIRRAQKAQVEFENYTQKQVDLVVKTIGKTVYDNARYLAELAVSETQMGVVEDKFIKNQMKAKIIWNSLKNKKSVGIINMNKETGIVEIAKPMGVVAAITPMTNPIVTPMSNAMFALKGRNAIIITPHHKAVLSSTKTIDLINIELGKIGAPEHLIQILDDQSRENTKNLIAATDIVIATGGMGMVKAAYSSGRPALGVGAGNVQCIIDEDADISVAAPLISRGRDFDNGILCSAEQSVIAPRKMKEEILEAFSKNNTYVIKDKIERDKLRDTIFNFGTMNKHVIGQNALIIAKMADIKVPEDTKVILVEAEQINDILGKEKMCPVLTLYLYDTFAEAVEIAKSNLEMEGKGHSVSIHSNNIEHIEYAALSLSVSRFVVNQCSATSAGGSFFNGFAPTNTLGCGSWGGNSISENLDYKHLINISRIGYYMKDNIVPNEEELWS